MAENGQSLSERVTALEAQVRIISRALDFVDVADVDEVREIAKTVRWAHERRLAGDARVKDFWRYAIAFVSAVGATILAGLLARHLGIGR